MAKILLVEDDKSLREIYGVRLLAEGYDIVSAGDGEEALAMAIKERPHLIVSDVMMPKISGFDMLDILRSTTETKDIKVIMMTALSSEDQRLRGEQLGADRYLVKSQVGIEDVVRTVHEVLGDSLVPQPQNTFAAPIPSAVPRPAPTTVPERPTAQPAPVAPPAPTMPEPQPVLAPTPDPVPQPTPVFTPPTPVAPTPSLPVAEPVAPVTPPAPVADPAVAPASALPQPTAPFSTARPAGLADRIIQPLERAEDSNEPIGSLMDKELGITEQSAPQAPAAPIAPPAPSIPEPVQPPLSSTPESHGISFEETPRPTN